VVERRDGTLGKQLCGRNKKMLAQKVSAVANSLASLKPAAVVMWDHEANSPLTPACVMAGIHKVHGFVDGGGAAVRARRESVQEVNKEPAGKARAQSKGESAEHQRAARVRQSLVTSKEGRRLRAGLPRPRARN
jgi:hypothetical protein